MSIENFMFVEILTSKKKANWNKISSQTLKNHDNLYMRMTSLTEEEGDVNWDSLWRH